MYEIFEKLCENKGIKPYGVAKETGVSTATLTSWKQGKYTPKDEKLQKLADFFGVSTEYLKTGKDSRFSDENAELFAKIRTDDELTDAIKTYFALPDNKKRNIIELIHLLDS